MAADKADRLGKPRLDPRTRKFITVLAVAEGVLKLIALIHLVRQPKESVRGNKFAWAAAITTINSVGAVPISYFVWGRRRGPRADR